MRSDVERRSRTRASPLSFAELGICCTNRGVLGRADNEQWGSPQKKSAVRRFSSTASRDRVTCFRYQVPVPAGSEQTPVVQSHVTVFGVVFRVVKVKFAEGRAVAT